MEARHDIRNRKESTALWEKEGVKVRSKGSPIISEPENAKSPIAYRYPYGTDNFVLKGKISGVKKSARVVPARRWKDNSKIERI